MAWKVGRRITLEEGMGASRMPMMYSISTLVWDLEGGFFMKLWAVHCDLYTLIMCYTGAKCPNKNKRKWF